MTRKHFAAIAKVIADHRCIAADRRDLDLIAYGLAAVCADANPNFDEARFLVACGVTS